ncbi:MAG: cysteine synthase family protein [candidate division Zixibacteria bacterium]
MDTHLQSLSHMVGNTPLLDISFRSGGKTRRIFAKAEHLNMTGSIKDRMAMHILRSARENGTLKPGDAIIEATSGNTGISFASLGRAMGHPVTIFMPDWMSRERVDLICSLGAKIVPVSAEEGGFVGSIKMSEELSAKSKDSFLPSQFSNSANVEAHYQTTGPEIWWQLASQKLRPDAFVAGVGTGGTVMGVGRYLREKNSEIGIHPMEPENSPTLRTGKKVGKHRIQGVSDEFIPAILDLKTLDEIIDVDDGDAILMAQKLTCELGLAVGISSGANFLAAVKVLDQLPDDSVVVTVFADDNKKYLSTDLLREEEVKPDHMTPGIELLKYEPIKRVCDTCDTGASCSPQQIGATVSTSQTD